MTGEVIKSFLVGLGFGVDEASLSKFNKAISSATTRVLGLYASVQAAAAGIFLGIQKISEGFEQMGYEYRIIAPAINKALILRRELLRAYSAAGINITKVVQESVKFNFSLAKTKFALEAIYKSVGAKFLPVLTKQMDIFRQKIYANMPKIQAALERFVKFIFKAFEATVILGQRLWSILTRVYDFFGKLDEKTNGWSTKILAAVAAWKLLNLEFIATPLGAIITGLIALLALYDDFQTYKEGGESFFNWAKIEPAVEAAIVVFKSLLDVIVSIFQTVGMLIGAFASLFTGQDKFRDFFEGIEKWASSAFGVIKNFGEFLLNFGKFFGTVPGVLQNFQPQALGQANGGPTSPLGVMQPPGQVSQNMRANTTINVQGTADPSSTAKSVASEQSRVNFDIVRNMKGATR